MTNTKAQVGDLIRITNKVEDRYNNGDILEVTAVSSSGIFVNLLNESSVLIYEEEYEIHRKAGEEDLFEATKDAVNSPQHYTQGRYEVIDIIEDAVEGATAFEAVCQANILKYTLRYRAKNGVEDLKKAQWYLDRLIKHLDEMF